MSRFISPTDKCKVKSQQNLSAMDHLAKKPKYPHPPFSLSLKYKIESLYIIRYIKLTSPNDTRIMETKLYGYLGARSHCYCCSIQPPTERGK